LLLYKNGFQTHQKEALPVVYVMEATGIYYELLAWYLHQKDYQVSVLLLTKLNDTSNA
jgi:transposase